MGRHLTQPSGAPSLVAEAERAVELSLANPAQAARVAAEVRRRAARERDLESATVAHRALGLAAKEQGDLAAASAHLRRAAALARRGRLTRRQGQAGMTLALVLALSGRTEEALAEADRAVAGLEGADAARLAVQRALILQRLGRLDEALEGYQSALQAFRRLELPADMARVHTNRGVLLAYRGDFPAAEADLVRAEEGYSQAGLQVAAADVHHNLGFVAALRGDIPAALARYDEAAQAFRRLSADRPAALLDRCQALLGVRLAGEARRLVAGVVEQLQAAGMEADLAEARLTLAQAALLDGDYEEARRAADLARRSFLAQQREGWAALARYTALAAAWRAGDLGPAGAIEAGRSAAELEATGWAVPAAEARLIAARILLDTGQVAEAEAQLRRTAAAQRSGPADLRARAWHASALLRLARSDRVGAQAALRAGLRVFDQHRATLGATELRAHVAAGAGELAALGLELALEGGRPRHILGWAERWRAGASRTPAVQPPADPAMAADLAGLRRVVEELEQAALAGDDTSLHLRRQAALERSIRRRTHRVPGSAEAALTSPPPVDVLAAALGDRALVEFVETGGSLHAVTVAGGRCRFRTLAAAGEVAAEVRHVRFSLGRLARSRGPAAPATAAGAALAHAACWLDQVLLAPLAPELSGRPLVLVPTGALHALPWAALPSCRGRSLTVVPSAAHWLASAGLRRPAHPSPAVLVAGPDVDHGEDEVAELARLHPGARTLVGPKATVADVASALAGAGLAHVAAHGRFRSDNPLFSSLLLADGPLTVYDLEALPRVPLLVVLSACDAGVSAVTAGDELMGLVAALLSLGAGTVVASVLPVGDAATRTLMVELHRRLTTGQPCADSLAAAQAAVTAAGPGEDPAVASVTGFTCFGAG